MALTNAQRAERRAELLAELRRFAYGRRGPGGKRTRAELTLQRGRSRPRVSGIVVYVATSGAFAILADDDWPADRDGAPASILGVPASAPRSLHVPVDAIRSVRPVGDARARARVCSTRS